MEEKKHPLGDLMGVTMDKVRGMADANTVVGEPIVSGDVTIIPISRVSVGFGTGGERFFLQKPEAGYGKLLWRRDRRGDDH